jgi:hypothetical protein
MTVPKAKMNEPVKPLHSVGVVAPKITAWRWNRYVHLLESFERVQAAEVANQRQVPPITEMVQRIDPIANEWIVSWHRLILVARLAHGHGAPYEWRNGSFEKGGGQAAGIEWISLASARARRDAALATLLPRSQPRCRRGHAHSDSPIDPAVHDPLLAPIMVSQPPAPPRGHRQSHCAAGCRGARSAGTRS